MKKLMVMTIALVASMSFPMNEVMAVPLKAEEKSSGQEIRTFNIGDFSEMDISMCNVVYTIGTPGEAVLTAPANLIDKYEVVVKNGKLVVSFNNKENDKEIQVNINNQVVLHVSSNSLEEIEAYNLSNVTILSPIVLHDEFKVEAATTATIELGTVVCEEFSAEVSTASNLTIARLDCKEADIEVNTSSKAKIQSSHISLTKVEANTCGSISFDEGNVGKVKFSANTIGKLQCKAYVESGKLEADTGGKIECSLQNVDVECDTGGKVKNI